MSGVCYSPVLLENWGKTHNPEYCLKQKGAEHVRVCHAIKSTDYKYCKYTKFCLEYAKVWLKHNQVRDIDKNVLGEPSLKV